MTAKTIFMRAYAHMFVIEAYSSVVYMNVCACACGFVCLCVCMCMWVCVHVWVGVHEHAYV